MPRRATGPPGLQAERTLLSWERSALGFLVGGALLLFRQHGPLAPGRVLLALVAAVLALLVLLLGRRRSRRLAADPVNAGQDIAFAPRREVVTIGVATVGFAMVILGALLYSAVLG